MTTVAKAAVHLLIATVPERGASVEQLLADVAIQSIVPETVHLVLDGYGDLSAPGLGGLPGAVCYRTTHRSGPGGRWCALRTIHTGWPDGVVLIVLDDDQRLLGENVIETLVKAVSSGGAAAYMGTDLDGRGGVHPAGTPLLCMGAGAMVVRVQDLQGLDQTLAEIREKCGFDPFGDQGDDEAVIAVHLWRRGVKMFATGLFAIAESPGTQEESQTEKRRSGDKPFFWQRAAIAKATGWPWRSL